MLTRQVSRFKELFPQYATDVYTYRSLDKQTILLGTKKSYTFIFAYHSNNTWKLYSYTSYKRAMDDWKRGGLLSIY